MPSRSQALLASLACALGLMAGLAPGLAPAAAAPRGQSVSIRVLPQLAAPGATPQPASSALSTVVATFSPVVVGRAVVLESRVGAGWVTVARTAQDSRGQVSLNAPFATRGAPATYRVTARSTPTASQITSASVRTDAWGSPILSDDFSGTILKAPWDLRQQGYEVPSRTCSRTDASAVGVGGGVLALRVIDDPARDDPCSFVTGQGEQQSTFYRLNGHVGTQGRFSYTYGVAAARIRFQAERGQHGAFWMQPAGSGYGAEIDVMEWFGNGSQGLINGVWDYSSGTQTRVAGGVVADQAAYGSDWAGTFHVFSVEWTPSAYVFRIDGREVLRTTAGVAQTDEYLILSLLVANFEANKLPSPEALPQAMQVDWVRVWQQ